MIIYGWGRRTSKEVGQSRTYTCPNCRNVNRFRLTTVRKWFTLFFIPLIPYETSHLELCPICRAGRKIGKAEMEDLLKEAMADQSYITGGSPAPSIPPVVDPGPSGQRVDP